MIDIQNTDCIEGMKRIQEGAIDVIICSPPYNIGTKYGKYKDDITGYVNFTDKWVREIQLTLSINGSFFLQVGSIPSNPWIAEGIAEIAMRHFTLQNKIYWIKSIDSIFIDNSEQLKDREYAKDIMVGHIKPINSERYLSDCVEMIYHFTKTGNIPIDKLAVGCQYSDKSNLTRGSRGKNGDVRCRGNAWYIPYQTIRSRSDRPHPATFPVELAKRCILLHGLDRCKIILDPFMGIGTTAIAAKELGKDCIGFEIDSEYCKITERKLKDVTIL